MFEVHFNKKNNNVQLRYLSFASNSNLNQPEDFFKKKNRQRSWKGSLIVKWFQKKYSVWYRIKADTHFILYYTNKKYSIGWKKYRIV